MCEMMGYEIDYSEMPIERSDLKLETQEVFFLFDKLQANWEGFSGSYLGKDLSLLPTLFEHYETEDYIRSYTWMLIPYIDSIISEDVAQKMKAKTKSKGDIRSG